MAAVRPLPEKTLKKAASGRKQEARIKQRPQPIKEMGEEARTAQRRPSARAAFSVSLIARDG